MDIYKKRILESAEFALKKTKAFQHNRELGVTDEENYKLSYVLFEGELATHQSVLAYAVSEDDVLLFYPIDEALHEVVLNGCLFFDYDLFQHLEGGYELAFMTTDAHSGAWYEISKGYCDNEIACMAGMQKYLRYCKDHNITQEKLAHDEGYDGENIMTLCDAVFSGDQGGLMGCKS